MARRLAKRENNPAVQKTAILFFCCLTLGFIYLMFELMATSTIFF